MEKSFIPNKFLAVCTFLGHLSMKNVFQIGPTVLALKLDKERVLIGGLYTCVFKSFSVIDHFFLQFLHIAEISKRAHNSRTLIPLVL